MHKIVSVTILILYGIFTLLSLPFHHHVDDGMFAGGRGPQTFSQHADALNCKHHAVETHSDCTICSIISHTVTNSVITVIPQFNQKLPQWNTAFFFAVDFDVCSTHSRRGPPIYPV